MGPTGPVTISGWRAMTAGGLAGLACWFVSFPPDVVKTMIQCNDRHFYKSTLFDGGFITASRVVYKEKGIGGFFNGFSAITGRALVANSIGFGVWELSRTLINLREIFGKK